MEEITPGNKREERGTSTDKELTVQPAGDD